MPNFDGFKNISDFDVSAIVLDLPTSYILEVDLEYSKYLHTDEHLPFCSTRNKPPGKQQDKLLSTVYDKKCYIIHYRKFLQCMRHGLHVTKIHRVLQFAHTFLWKYRVFVWIKLYYSCISKNCAMHRISTILRKSRHFSCAILSPQDTRSECDGILWYS